MTRPAPVFEHLYTAGAGGYHSCRIPALGVTIAGTVLAFCEGRRGGSGDSGEIDLLVRRSTDGGTTWSPARACWHEAGETCGNPCVVTDRETGTVWLLATRNHGDDTEQAIIAGTSRGTRTVWVLRSDDDGRTWSEPREITNRVKRDGWAWYATGPGAGIQLRSGHLVIPCDHIATGGGVAGSHVIVSDDHGETWRLGGVVPHRAVNECQVVERADGSLLLNMRSHDRTVRRRLVATSPDGGLTWSEAHPDPALPDPICQASLCRFGEHGILFGNPASETSRARLTVRRSADGGRTWPVAKVLHAGPAAYSCLVHVPDGTIACLYENGEHSPYERITLARFDPAWLESPDE